MTVPNAGDFSVYANGWDCPVMVLECPACGWYLETEAETRSIRDLIGAASEHARLEHTSVPATKTDE